MKSTANSFLITLLKLPFLAACFVLLTSYQPYKRLWQVSDLEPFNEWFQINWQGQVVGWAQKRLEKSDDHFTVYQKEHFEGRVRGLRVMFSYEHSFSFDSKRPYKLINGSATLREPNLVMTTEFSNLDKLVISQTRNAEVTHTERNPINYTLPQYLSWRQFIEQRPSLNDSHQVIELAPHELLLEETSLEVVQLPQGRHQRYQVKTSTGNLLEVSPKGFLLSERRARGIKLVSSRHKPSFNPEMQTDLYSNVGLTSDKPLGELAAIETLRLELVRGKEWLNIHPSASVEGEILVTRRSPRYKASRDEMASWRFYQSSDAITKLLPKIPKNSNHQDTVEQLVHFVHDFLYYQPTPTSFSTEEIIDNGYGDCTEYTQLLLELLNAQKIPAREVSGYIYLGDDEQKFGGHAWVEVLLDGEWVGVDPTWNLTEVTAGHLPITIPQEKSVSDLDFSVEQIHYK